MKRSTFETNDDFSERPDAKTRQNPNDQSTVKPRYMGELGT